MDLQLDSAKAHSKRSIQDDIFYELTPDGYSIALK